MMQNENQKEEERLIHAAWLYYEMGLTQQEIAKRMMVSRATIGRLIQLARDMGIVKIKITKPLPKHVEVEEELLKISNLSQVLVVESDASHRSTREFVAKASADFLVRNLFPGCKIGLAWSNTLSLMINYLKYSDVPSNISIHELVGTILSVHTDFSVASRLAEQLNASLERIPVPILVNNKTARDAILHEESIFKALENASKVNLAFVGLGSIDQDSSLIKTQYLDINQISEMARRGAVGEVLFHFYDKDGKKIINNELEERTIGIKWPEFLDIKNVIAVATGSNKVKPILGALNGKFIHTLITDLSTAQSVIANLKEV